MDDWPYSPHLRLTEKACWLCRWYGGMNEAVASAVCLNPEIAFEKAGISMRSNPGMGCVSFEREPGTDDEPGWSPEGYLPKPRS